MGDTVIAILGAGQLGRMLALAAYPLGLRVRLLDPAPDSPAGQLAEHLVGSYGDEAALAQLAVGASVATYEFENVPLEMAQALAARMPVFPPPAALEASQDRLVEKRFFERLCVPTPGFAPVDSREELGRALDELGTPAVLKTRRMGYDGKGQFVLRTPSDVDAAWEALGGQPLILEQFVDFARELSIIAVRARDGATAFYPLVENHHRGGILRRSIAPAPNVSVELQAEAEAIATGALHALNYVGVLAIELFQTEGRPSTVDGGSVNQQLEARADDGTVYRPQSTVHHLVVNEMAPRVHNSGHWTIEGAETSQFENHIRAIAGMPLGSTALRGRSVMLNLIGTVPDTNALLAIRGAHLHLYGKAPRAGRKLGHITLLADDEATLAERVERAQRLIDEGAGKD